MADDLSTTNLMPFKWLMTQEDCLLSTNKDKPTNQQAPLSNSTRASSLSQRPFTQISFPSFTQLVSDETLKIPDPYKPPPEPKSPQELSELAWIVVQMLPHKDVILQDLLYIFENSKTKLGRTLEIGLKTPLTSTPFLQTFLAKCPLLHENEFSSSSSSSEDSSESDDSEVEPSQENSSMDKEEHPVLLQNKSSSSSLETVKENDIINDLEISSSEDEIEEVCEMPLIEEDTAGKVPTESPEAPEESQTQHLFGLDMPDLSNTAAKGTQTDLTMVDIEKLMRKTKGSKEIQLSGRASENGKNESEVPTKKRKKPTVRIRLGLPRYKGKKGERKQ
ncbi:uncharacterized protein LOC132192665 [Neocloeon triangulifer]|uniref:uncharacterized protein LOC132192665 n=1 Tax=Neocloeon triangulifer TaxID=2078957 RepID=UPI00286F0930|nr:uncharacterized protein LOC132192665 [Neocloeon triangulifer]